MSVHARGFSGHLLLVYLYAILLFLPLFFLAKKPDTFDDQARGEIVDYKTWPRLFGKKIWPIWVALVIVVFFSL